MDRPRFYDYTELDHAQARSIPYVADLIEWVAHERNRALLVIPEFVRMDKPNEARHALAQYDVMGEFLARFAMKDAPKPEAEEKFVDPRMPESARE